MSIESEALRALLVDARAVLFDFDGPLCDVFAGLPASTVARRLEALLGRKFDTDDPLEVLQAAAQLGKSAVRVVEDELIVAEIEAIDCSSTTPGGVESIQACLAAGKLVGVVSNNSQQAVKIFLEREGLLADVHPVVGRAYANPELMKPHPRPLREALDSLQISADSAIFFGDSISDIKVAKIVGVEVVAFANKASKLDKFKSSGVVVIESMFELVNAFHARE